MASIGILGGTFNPPHLGHLAVARRAHEELALERVLLMPVHTPPHKAGEGDPGPSHRLAMCQLLVADEPGVEACALEVRRGGPSYTADTLASIHSQHPDAQLTFIMGADTALTLVSWHDPQRVVELARLAVAARTGARHGAVLEAIGAVDGRALATVRFLEMEPIDVSSSLARERAAAGDPIDGLLGATVVAYIREHALYGVSDGQREGEHARG